MTMPCYQSTSLPSGVTTTGRTGYATEAECLQACQEGACCEGTTCTVKPQCQCQGTGKTFKGVGTVCTPNTCDPCCQGATQPASVVVEITGVDRVSPENVSLSFSIPGAYVIPQFPATTANATDCFIYRDGFYANQSFCFVQANPCFGGCPKKLDITILNDGMIIFAVCDSVATSTTSGVVNAGGTVWGYIPNWPAKVCARTSVSATTTQRNSPNQGGVLNAISYSIRFP